MENFILCAVYVFRQVTRVLLLVVNIAMSERLPPTMLMQNVRLVFLKNNSPPNKTLHSTPSETIFPRQHLMY